MRFNYSNIFLNDLFFIISDIDTIRYVDDDPHILSNHWKKHLVLTYFKNPDKSRTLIINNNEKITTKFGVILKTMPMRN